MKIAVVLPLFSEHAIRDYLGINLLVDFLKNESNPPQVLDLNERLVDYLLADTSRFSQLFSARLAQAENAGSPYFNYFELYQKAIFQHQTASNLKKNALYDHFFKQWVLPNLGLDIFAQQPVAQVEKRLPETLPLLHDFLVDEAADFVNQNYDAILVSVPHVDQLMPGLLFGKYLKQTGSGARIIFGGSSITLLDDSTLSGFVSDGFLDGYVKYSGENKLKDMLNSISTGSLIDQEKMAEKAYVDINTQTISYDPTLNRTSVPILYSRGCYWGKCTYCTYIHLDSGKFKRKDTQVLLDELAEFSGKPVRISLITEALTPKDARKIAEGILERGIKITWGSFMRVDTGFDAPIFDLLKRAGCIFTAVGVESVNDRILDFFNKGYRSRDVHQFFEAAEKANYRFFQCNFMYGSPMATLEDELDNIAFISRFRKTMGNIAFFRLEITRKSALGKDLEKHGIQINPNSTRKAIRVDNIPFLLQLEEKELALVERSYAAAADYFIQRDLTQAVQSLLNHPKRPLDFSAMLLFEFQGGRYVGSTRSPMIKELPDETFSKLSASDAPSPEKLSREELMTLFELKILNTDQFFWGPISEKESA